VEFRTCGVKEGGAAAPAKVYKPIGKPCVLIMPSLQAIHGSMVMIWCLDGHKRHQAPLEHGSRTLARFTVRSLVNQDKFMVRQGCNNELQDERALVRGRLGKTMLHELRCGQRLSVLSQHHVTILISLTHGLYCNLEIPAVLHSVPAMHVVAHFPKNNRNNMRLLRPSDARSCDVTISRSRARRWLSMQRQTGSMYTHVLLRVMFCFFPNTRTETA
jgi:hypothetical protein